MNVRLTDVEVLTKVYLALGTPTDESWGGLRAMPAFVEFQATPAPGLRKLFPDTVVGVSSGSHCSGFEPLLWLLAWPACGRVTDTCAALCCCCPLHPQHRRATMLWTCSLAW